jgi:hypothetical protein
LGIGVTGGGTKKGLRHGGHVVSCVVGIRYFDSVAQTFFFSNSATSFHITAFNRTVALFTFKLHKLLRHAGQAG